MLQLFDFGFGVYPISTFVKMRRGARRGGQDEGERHEVPAETRLRLELAGKDIRTFCPICRLSGQRKSGGLRRYDAHK